MSELSITGIMAPREKTDMAAGRWTLASTRAAVFDNSAPHNPPLQPTGFAGG